MGNQKTKFLYKENITIKEITLVNEQIKKDEELIDILLDFFKQKYTTYYSYLLLLYTYDNKYKSLESQQTYKFFVEKKITSHITKLDIIENFN